MFDSIEFMKIILSFRIEIDKDIVQKAAERSEIRMMKLLITQGSIDTIEQVVVAAAGNENSGVEVTKLLLAQGNIDITEQVACLIVEEYDEKVVELLLAQSNIKITEQIVEAAAGNWKFGKGVMELLLAQGSFDVVEQSVRVVLGNDNSSKEVVKLLLARIFLPLINSPFFSQVFQLQTLIETDSLFKIAC